MKKIKTEYVTIFWIVLAVAALAGAFANQWPWITSEYNSYLIQVKSWLLGRLDLGQNYEDLEIAIYNGKYYLSFPPFPAYVMLPFYVLFGDAFMGGVLAYVSMMLAIVYCYKIYSHYKSDNAMFFAILTTLCTNYLFIAVNDWVWFIAQNMCFTLTVMAIYYAICGKGFPCFILWACAVGCRPFTVWYLPVLIMLCYRGAGTPKKSVFIAELTKWGAIPAVIGLSYMVLNFLRFGNPFEFGHNYLIEFLEAPEGQFSLNYALTNLYKLVRLPGIENGLMTFYEYNGTNMFLASPIFIVGAVMIAKGILKGDKIVLVSLLCLLAELFCIVCHKTMGGWHFGNRYTIDIIPFVIYSVAAHRKKFRPVYVFLAMTGLGLNLIWMTYYIYA